MKRVLPLLLLLPVACAQLDPADPAVVLQEALASHQASVAGLVSPSPAAGGEGTPTPSAAREAPRAGNQDADAAAPNMAGQLVGQPREVVLRWLGEPRLRREEGPAEIWHYQATQCHLDLVLYREEGPQPVLRVAFASARAVGAARRGEAACLRDIGRGATTPPRGQPSTEQADLGA